jgi:hypothetical protein
MSPTQRQELRERFEGFRKLDPDIQQQLRDRVRDRRLREVAPEDKDRRTLPREPLRPDAIGRTRPSAPPIPAIDPAGARRIVRPSPPEPGITAPIQRR